MVGPSAKSPKRSWTNEPQISRDSRLPRSVQAMSLLWTLTFPNSILVCLAFWTLINPIWDMKMHPNFVTPTCILEMIQAGDLF
eukprot:symbB.v1.2.029254.t1/scaffold3179.1/size61902/3